MLIPMLSFGAAWMPDERAKELAVDFRAALDSWLSEVGAGWKYAADLMDVSQAEMSDWFACRKAMNLFRFSALPAPFWEHLLSVRAKRIGGLFLTADVVLLLRGAAFLKNTMRKAALPARAKKEHVA